MYKVIIDCDDEITNVDNWHVEGNVLILRFPDGSYRGITGFIDFTVNPTDNPNVR